MISFHQSNILLFPPTRSFLITRSRSFTYDLTISTGACSRCYGLLTIFTALFGAPRALPTLFRLRLPIPVVYLQYTLPLSTKAALNRSTIILKLRPFLGAPGLLPTLFSRLRLRIPIICITLYQSPRRQQ